MCDMAGTTVSDDVAGVPLVTHVLQRVFQTTPFGSIAVSPDEVTPLRGRKKVEMVRQLVQMKWADIQAASKQQNIACADQEQVVETLFASFESLLAQSVEEINSEIPGTSDIFRWLHSRGVKIGVGSGFSAPVVNRIVDQIGWRRADVGFHLAYVGSAGDSGAGRPDPTMILNAMRLLAITDPRRVVKIGDTAVDVEEGRRAGCITVAVLSGTQTRDELARTKPDFIVESIAQLRGIWPQLESMAIATSTC